MSTSRSSRAASIATPIAVLALALLWTGVAPAAAAEAPADATPAVDVNAAFVQELLTDFARTGDRLQQLAAAIPAESYGWRPAEGVRSVSEVFVHLANVHVFLPIALGAPPLAGYVAPENPLAAALEREAALTGKPEVEAALAESIDYARQAVEQIQDLDGEANVFGFPATKRAYLMILLTHTHEHFGQAIAYARSIGVTPPWSQPNGDSAAPADADGAAPATDDAPADDDAG